MVDLGKIAYEAYFESVGGISRFTGNHLPAWGDQTESIQAAWTVAAFAVRAEVWQTESADAGPPVVTDEAVRAALNAEYGAPMIALSGFAGRAVAEMRTALEAALPHLVATPSAEDIRVDAAYQRGIAAASAMFPVKHSKYDLPSGDSCRMPSDHEMWRDAWILAVGNASPDASPRVLAENAEWFLDRLKAGPPGPPIPDCKHCGADSSMDHDDDCPNADDGTRADEDPTDDEVDCVRCGAPPGGHPDGCPTMAYPGHDATVTIGACRPDSPCPACQQQMAAETADYLELRFPGVNPDGTGTGEWSGRAGG